MKKLLAVILLLLSASAAFCADQYSENVLRVGTDANFPPYEYYQPVSGSYTGFEIELIEALAPLMGYKYGVSFVNVDFENILTGLAEGQYDIVVAGLTVTPERARIVAFSVPYIDGGKSVVVPIDADAPEGPAAMNGKRVATERSSSAYAAASQVASPAELIAASDTEEALKMVCDGRADCAIASYVASAFFLANGYGDRLKLAGGEKIMPDKVAAAVRLNDEKLLQKFNDALAMYTKSAAYKMLCMTYFGTED